MHVHSMNRTMNAVANTGGMSTKPTKGGETAGAVNCSPTRMLWTKHIPAFKVTIRSKPSFASST
jgi:hypothetical protein